MPIRCDAAALSAAESDARSRDARSPDRLATSPHPSAMDRRAFLRLGGYAGLAGLCWGLLPAHFADAAGPVYCNPNRPTTPADAMAALMAGNGLWATGNQQHPGEDTTRRDCVAQNDQTPFAAILSCADSRVPPALIFDQGLGDLFVVRVAGNSNTAVGQQSLAYGVNKLHALALLVLGHQGCGAVSTAVTSFPRPAPAFVSLIYPAVRKARLIVQQGGGNPDDPTQVIPVAIEQHALMTAAQLSVRTPFKDLIRNGSLIVAAGVYSLDNQAVTILT